MCESTRYCLYFYISILKQKMSFEKIVCHLIVLLEIVGCGLNIWVYMGETLKTLQMNLDKPNSFVLQS